MQIGVRVSRFDLLLIGSITTYCRLCYRLRVRRRVVCMRVSAATFLRSFMETREYFPAGSLRLFCCCCLFVSPGSARWYLPRIPYQVALLILQQYVRRVDIFVCSRRNEASFPALTRSEGRYRRWRCNLLPPLSAGSPVPASARKMPSAS